MKLFVQYINALIIIVLGGVLTGAYIVQYSTGEMPCPLCILQRAAMIGVAMGEMMNLRFGIKSHHYALSYFSALFGAAVSLRQITLHICPSMPSYPVGLWGLTLYTWAFLVFVCVMLSISVLHFLHPLPRGKHEDHKIPVFGWIAIIFIMLITAANVITTFQECGIFMCYD